MLCRAIVSGLHNQQPAALYRCVAERALLLEVSYPTVLGGWEFVRDQSTREMSTLTGQYSSLRSIRSDLSDKTLRLLLCSEQ